MKRWFLDTNILLDLVLKRPPFEQEARQLWQMVTSKQLTVFTSSHALATCYYFCRKEFGHITALSVVDDLLNTMTVLAVDETILRQAVGASFNDFEDTIQYFTALSRVDVEAIVTRDPKDFRFGRLTVLSPQAALSLLL